MACRAAWQRPINSFQMVLKQDATIVGDAVANCKGIRCRYQRTNRYYETITMGTNFFTNEKENTLLEKIEGVFKYKKVHFFDALVGYFRASGYFRIRKFIQQTPKIRILVGINVDK